MNKISKIPCVKQGDEVAMDKSCSVLFANHVEDGQIIHWNTPKGGKSKSSVAIRKGQVFFTKVAASTRVTGPTLSIVKTDDIGYFDVTKDNGKVIGKYMMKEGRDGKVQIQCK